MKNMRQLPDNISLKSFRLCAWMVTIVLICGCIPYPHKTIRSLEIRGRLLDARTHEPINGAMVFLNGCPKTSSVSDSTGYFCLKATYNFHVGVLPPEGHWPQGRYCGSDFTITHTNYLAQSLFAWRGEEGVILLVPRN
jgi:hypothetical protein